MREKTKKATFNLPIGLLESIDEIMASGMVSSKNALVEQALIKELNELKKQSRQKQWQEGAKDPLLIKDIEGTDKNFYTADAETARRIS
jgi:metal-responsive CopG/Arc/MetJ family transcriptional regulator